MKQWKGFITGMLTTILLAALTSIAVASTGSKEAVLTYRNIKITLDGVEVTPKDVNGGVVEPFIVDGITYLPVRGIANALGLGVDWVEETSTVVLTKNGSAISNSPSRGTTNSSGGEVSYKITYQNCQLRENAYSSNTYYRALVEIENTGSANIYLKDAIFDFEDKSGSLLATDRWISRAPDIIAPGEKGYFYGNGSLDGNINVHTDYVFKPKLTVERSKLDLIRYEVSDLSIKDTEYGRVGIIGRVTNNTNEDALLPHIVVVLYRVDGTPITVEYRNISELNAWSSTSFDTHSISIDDMGATPEDVASYKVFACKTQYQF